MLSYLILLLALSPAELNAETLRSSPVLWSFTSEMERAYDEQRNDKIDAYLAKITKTQARFEAVDDVLADTVLEGYECEELVKGELSKECKQAIRQQAIYELGAL